MLISIFRKISSVIIVVLLLFPGLFLWGIPVLALADSGKTKVLYHMDGDDVGVATYAIGAHQ
jgi:hypothetical protein